MTACSDGCPYSWLNLCLRSHGSNSGEGDSGLCQYQVAVLPCETIVNGFGLFRFGFPRKSFLLPRRQPGLAGPNRLPRFAGLNTGRFFQPLRSKPAETWAGRGGCPAPVQRDPPRRGERPRQPLAGWSLSCPPPPGAQAISPRCGPGRRQQPRGWARGWFCRWRQRWGCRFAPAVSGTGGFQTLLCRERRQRCAPCSLRGRPFTPRVTTRHFAERPLAARWLQWDKTDQSPWCAGRALSTETRLRFSRSSPHWFRLRCFSSPGVLPESAATHGGRARPSGHPGSDVSVVLHES